MTVFFSGNMSTTQNNMFSFNPSNGNLTAGLQFDPPFTRLAERNNYRQQLINYQQDRRTLIQFEDNINQTLRQDLRTLKQLQLNLEIQRRAVAIAVRRVDKTLEDLNQPPEPVAPGQPAAQLSPTAALNLLTAISDLRNAQNNFMSVWMNYYSERVQFVRDLGVMKVDERGMWIDEPIDATLAPYFAEPSQVEQLPPVVPDEWLRDAGFDPAKPLEEQLPQPKKVEPQPGETTPSNAPRPLPMSKLEDDEASRVRPIAYLSDEPIKNSSTPTTRAMSARSRIRLPAAGTTLPRTEGSQAAEPDSTSTDPTATSNSYSPTTAPSATPNEAPSAPQKSTTGPVGSMSPLLSPTDPQPKSMLRFGAVRPGAR
jgi:hypothetical protein